MLVNLSLGLEGRGPLNVFHCLRNAVNAQRFISLGLPFGPLSSSTGVMNPVYSITIHFTELSEGSLLKESGLFDNFLRCQPFGAELGISN